MERLAMVRSPSKKPVESYGRVGMAPALAPGALVVGSAVRTTSRDHPKMVRGDCFTARRGCFTAKALVYWPTVSCVW